jgi:hypothetical protein
MLFQEVELSPSEVESALDQESLDWIRSDYAVRLLKPIREALRKSTKYTSKQDEFTYEFELKGVVVSRTIHWVKEKKVCNAEPGSCEMCGNSKHPTRIVAVPNVSVAWLSQDGLSVVDGVLKVHRIKEGALLDADAMWNLVNRGKHIIFTWCCKHYCNYIPLCELLEP